ncbi:MAG TPA: hypothetical protein VLB27_00300 [candidate division Zixibacteria bacterium]|nr:hypothetical protein [candidate division Zixibacteria bacterium]
MNTVRTVLLVVALALAALSCTKIDYVGRSYLPTAHVDIYFSLDDVTTPYEVMGHMVAHANDMVSAEKMQKKMVEKAKEKGADAVVILGLERYQSGEKTSTSETAEDDDGKIKVKSSSSTEAEFEKEITATLLKYK